MGKISYVYIIGNERPTIYVGVTSNLIQRISQHKENLVKGFSQKYDLHKLLYYEHFAEIEYALEREKQLKRWHRQWKLNLIEKENPTFRDLYPDLMC